MVLFWFCSKVSSPGAGAASDLHILAVAQPTPGTLCLCPPPRGCGTGRAERTCPHRATEPVLPGEKVLCPMPHGSGRGLQSTRWTGASLLLGRGEVPLLSCSSVAGSRLPFLAPPLNVPLIVGSGLVSGVLHCLYTVERVCSTQLSCLADACGRSFFPASPGPGLQGALCGPQEVPAQAHRRSRRVATIFPRAWSVCDVPGGGVDGRGKATEGGSCPAAVTLGIWTPTGPQLPCAPGQAVSLHTCLAPCKLVPASPARWGRGRGSQEYTAHGAL